MLPSGTYFESFDREARYLRTKPQIACFAGLLILLAIFPFVSNDYLLGIASMMFITTIPPTISEIRVMGVMTAAMLPVNWST